MKRAWAALVAALLLMSAEPASAGLVMYNDGGSHTVNSAVDAVVVSDGGGGATTSVSVEAGALIGSLSASGSSEIDIISGNIAVLFAHDASIVDIFGSSFELNGSAVGFGSLTGGGILTGMFGDNSTFSTIFAVVDPGANINLIDANSIVDDIAKTTAVLPEPASMAVWSLLGCLGLAFRCWRRKRRTA